MRTRVRAVRDALVDGDPSRLTKTLLVAASKRRWMRPVAYVGQTLEAVIRAIVLNWRLILVAIAPAVWIAAITWDWRAHATGRYLLPAVYGWVAVVVMLGVVAANLVAYWCNATIAFTLMRGSVDVRAAFADAKAHARVINAWAFIVGVCQGLLSVFVSGTTVGWMTVALGVIAVVQMYALLALPAALAGARPSSTTRSMWDRASAMALIGAVTAVTAAPGFVLNRVALLIIAVGARSVGFVVLVVAIVVQIAGTSSAYTVSIATKVAPSAKAGQA